MSELIQVLEDNLRLRKAIIFRRFAQHVVIEVAKENDKDLNENCQLLPLSDHFKEDKICGAIRLLALKIDGF